MTTALDILGVAGFALVGIGIALVLTLVFETITAALFRVGTQGIKAVALVNLVTNPVFSLLLIVGTLSPGTFGAWGNSASIALLEIAVVIVEWRLLKWALHTSIGSSHRLLVLSVVMNVASVAGGWLTVFMVGAITGAVST